MLLALLVEVEKDRVSTSAIFIPARQEQLLWLRMSCSWKIGRHTGVMMMMMMLLMLLLLWLLLLVPVYILVVDITKVFSHVRASG